jgi:hypothetical protein
MTAGCQCRNGNLNTSTNTLSEFIYCITTRDLCLGGKIIEYTSLAIESDRKGSLIDLQSKRPDTLLTFEISTPKDP